MVAPVILQIRLVGGIVPRLCNLRCNEHIGGRDVLLRWLENQLGLLQNPVPLSSRIAEYGAVLEKAKIPFFRESLKNDRWATATELLVRRDELRMAGWNEGDSTELPPLISGLAKVATSGPLTWPDEAERLRRVVEALDDGQVLPKHRCVLYDPLQSWPSVWRKVLSRLSVETCHPAQPCAINGIGLRKAQELTAHGESAPLQLDASIQWIESRSELAACEAVASALSQNPERLQETVICCNSISTALCLDGCFSFRGLPTMGAFARSLFHPVLQVLPLVLNLCWEPVDPKLVLDFLSLPIGPIPRRAARKLAAALATQPGLGSSEWDRVANELCTAENDPEGKLRESLRSWLSGPRYARGLNLPSKLVAECASRVAQWAAGYSAALEKDATKDQNGLIGVLRLAAGHASTLAELAQIQGGDISESQLLRLRDASMTQGGISIPSPETAGAPTLVSSLAEIGGPCKYLIWIGLGTKDPAVSRWTTLERRVMKQIGVDLCDGNSGTVSLRDAERSGFLQTTEALLAISVPTDEDSRPHPIWQLIQASLAESKIEKPLAIEELLGTHGPGAVGMWQFSTTDYVVEASHPQRPLWSVNNVMFREQASHSATELQDRLACPLKWVFRHQANLYPSPIARLPDSFRLKGDFCHSLLEQVFGNGDLLPSVVEAQERVASLFDKRLPLDAAPLAQPNQIADRQSLREELLRSTATLVKAMQGGNYRIKGIEVEISGTVFGRPLKGWVDCVGERDDGNEVIVDFKYGGYSKYKELLENGRAVQLATYAFSRSQKPDGKTSFPAVAYLVLKSNILYSPKGSPVLGDGGATVIDAPAIAAVWDRFVSAITNAEGWLNGNEPVPARPLQVPDKWPKEIDLVLDGPNVKGMMPELQAVCEYCDYQTLCGLRRLS